MTRTFSAAPLTDEQRAEVLRLVREWEVQAKLHARFALEASRDQIRRQWNGTADIDATDRARIETYDEALRILAQHWVDLPLDPPAPTDLEEARDD